MNSYKWAEPIFRVSAHICIIQEFFLHVNKTCLKQAGFTGCGQLGVLQNRFPAENESVPNPAGDRSIFS